MCRPQEVAGSVLLAAPTKVMKMRTVSRILAAVVLLALVLSPLAVSADQLMLPMEKKLQAGVNIVQYGDQSFRFVSPVRLFVKFNPVGPTAISMEVRIYGSPSGTSTDSVEIEWMNWGAEIHVGTLPVSGLLALLNTESGMTEK
jgi:hypothetical protein